jgi:hypothetical protein
MYAMSSKSRVFGTGMMKFNEEKAYGKSMKVVAVPSFVKLDKDLEDIVEFLRRYWHFI